MLPSCNLLCIVSSYAFFFFINNSIKKLLFWFCDFLKKKKPLLFWFCVNTESLRKAKSKQWMKCSNVVSKTPTCSISLFLQYIGKVVPRYSNVSYFSSSFQDASLGEYILYISETASGKSLSLSTCLRK